MTVCPACGNVMVNGRCSRCNANQFKRDQHWRTGDRGGKRPERHGDPYEFTEIIDGTWYDSDHGIVIDIDIQERICRYSYPDGEVSEHSWRFWREDLRGTHFYQDMTPVTCRINAAGLLIMFTEDERLTCIYVFEGKRYRTCPKCYKKSPMEDRYCTQCGRRFR